MAPPKTFLRESGRVVVYAAGWSVVALMVAVMVGFAWKVISLVF